MPMPANTPVAGGDTAPDVRMKNAAIDEILLADELQGNGFGFARQGSGWREIIAVAEELHAERHSAFFAHLPTEGQGAVAGGIQGALLYMNRLSIVRQAEGAAVD